MYDQRLEFAFTMSRGLSCKQGQIGKTMVIRIRGVASVRCEYGVDSFSFRRISKSGQCQQSWAVLAIDEGVLFCIVFKLIIDIKNSLAYLLLLNRRHHRHPNHPS
jgi:hypothetical protein